MQYAYDKEDNLASISYPDNTKVTYGYDKNQLKQATLANGEVINWSDYRWFMPSKVTYPNATQTKQYDSLQRPLLIGLTANRKTLLNRQYSYDKVGNITRIATENGENNYQYDLLDRLILAKPNIELQKHGVTVESYSYDAIGNRIGSTQQLGEWKYNKFNQLIKWGESTSQTTLSYTPNSQLATEVSADKKLSYHYNAAERLISVNDETTELVTYQYDPFGRRISKTINGDITYFIYTNEGLIAELDHRGQMTVAYGWVPDTEWGTSPLWQASLTVANQTLQTASYHYLITDHLGTPQLAINNQGQQTWKMHSDAFGNAVLDPNNQITLNLRFPGQYYDKETGLSYNYFRDYNPKIGRYIQSDPIGLNGGINTFSYASGNPLLYRDPLGENPAALLFGGIRGCTANPVCATLMRRVVGGIIARNVLNSLVDLHDYDNHWNEECYRNSVNIAGKKSRTKNSTSGVGSSNNEDPDDDKNKKYKVPKPKVSGKEGAKDVPDWAKEYRPYVGENGKKFAKRIMNKKYGKGNYDTTTNTEFSKIKKWGDRSFINP
ncbi:RHS repeat domain-containing protein [Gilliamella sp. ESL0250]|uniref:RHS repeat domain-containing protein n=1 Tax=Gilliamella sp. ESL0250 TaxID=2705036 RepID=UPI001580C96A|nr:RHS repeat-associated core domain-containing protein [Gilliamella sp. ESL0250]NUF49913.1 hypothetical protein [Gilliamella sp. ESL0250]